MSVLLPEHAIWIWCREWNRDKSTLFFFTGWSYQCDWFSSAFNFTLICLLPIFTRWKVRDFCIFKYYFCFLFSRNGLTIFSLFSMIWPCWRSSERRKEYIGVQVRTGVPEIIAHSFSPVISCCDSNSVGKSYVPSQKQWLVPLLFFLSHQPRILPLASCTSISEQ